MEVVVHAKLLEQGKEDITLLKRLVAYVEVEPLPPDSGHQATRRLIAFQDADPRSTPCGIDRRDQPGDPGSYDDHVVGALRNRAGVSRRGRCRHCTLLERHQVSNNIVKLL